MIGLRWLLAQWFKGLFSKRPTQPQKQTPEERREQTAQAISRYKEKLDALEAKFQVLTLKVADTEPDRQTSGAIERVRFKIEATRKAIDNAQVKLEKVPPA